MESHHYIVSRQRVHLGMLKLDILDTIKLQALMKKKHSRGTESNQHFFFVALSRGELDQHY